MPTGCVECFRTPTRGVRRPNISLLVEPSFRYRMRSLCELGSFPGDASYALSHILLYILIRCGVSLCFFLGICWYRGTWHTRVGGAVIRFFLASFLQKSEDRTAFLRFILSCTAARWAATSSCRLLSSSAPPIPLQLQLAELLSESARELLTAASWRHSSFATAVTRRYTPLPTVTVRLPSSPPC